MDASSPLRNRTSESIVPEWRAMFRSRGCGRHLCNSIRRVPAAETFPFETRLSVPERASWRHRSVCRTLRWGCGSAEKVNGRQTYPCTTTRKLRKEGKACGALLTSSPVADDSLLCVTQTSRSLSSYCRIFFVCLFARVELELNRGAFAFPYVLEGRAEFGTEQIGGAGSGRCACLLNITQLWERTASWYVCMRPSGSSEATLGAVYGRLGRHCF